MHGRIASNTVLLGSVFGLGLLCIYSILKGSPIYLTVIPAILGVSITLCFLLAPVLRSRIALAIATTGAMLILAETILEVIAYKGLRSEAVAAAEFWMSDNSQYDNRSQSELINDLMQEEGLRVYPLATVGTLGIEGIKLSDSNIFPFGGIAKSATVLCNESGDYIVYTSDEHGFHNPIGIWDNAIIDIGVVGDSFTHGMCVESKSNFVSQIRSVYPSTLNLGLAGTGPVTHFATIKEFFKDLKPKAVLWVYYEGNDLGDITEELHAFPYLNNYLVKGDFTQGLLYKQADIDDHLKVEFEGRMLAKGGRLLDNTRENQLRHVSTVGAVTVPTALLAISTLRNLRLNLLKIMGVRGVIDTDAQRDNIVTLTRMLEMADAYVDSWGGQLYLVYLPSWERYHNPLGSASIQHTMLHDQVISETETLRIPVIDVSIAFDKHADPLGLWPFRFQGHYNEKGHSVVAETILDSFGSRN